MKQAKTEWPHQTPVTKEAYYFRKIFTDFYGIDRHNILPNYWMPKWDEDGNEIKDYVDPSARTLELYD